MARERELVDVTRDLVDCIETDNDLNQAHLVASCIEGLDKANAQIGNRKSIYNSSAMAHQRLKRGSFLRQPKSREEFTVFDSEEWDMRTATGS